MQELARCLTAAAWHACLPLESDTIILLIPLQLPFKSGQCRGSIQAQQDCCSLSSAPSRQLQHPDSFPCTGLMHSVAGARPQVQSKTVAGLLALVESERRGEAVDRGLAGHLLRMFSSLGTYASAFQAPFLQQSQVRTCTHQVPSSQRTVHACAGQEGQAACRVGCLKRAVAGLSNVL